MDEQPIPVPPEVKAETHLNFFAKNKRLFISIVIFIVVLTLIIISMIMYSKYTNTSKIPIKITQNSLTPTSTPSPLRAYVSSTDLTTENGVTFFTGEIINKEKTFFEVRGSGKTLKINVQGNLYFSEMPKLLTMSLQEYQSSNPKIIDYTQIKNGDIVNVTVKMVNNAPTAIVGLIFK